jgi:hypothetical protein
MLSTIICLDQFLKLIGSVGTTWRMRSVGRWSFGWEDSVMSVPSGSNPKHAKLPGPERFEGIDKAIILCLIFTFLVVWGWLSYRVDQGIYQYWAFITLLTLVFVGVLRAAGVVRTGWLVLSGSAAVFVGLLWATSTTFEKYDLQQTVIAELKGDVISLTGKNSALQRQIDNYQRQDLGIVTFDATNQKSIQYLKFRYVLRTGPELDAQYDQTNHHYFVPAAHVSDLFVIWPDFDLLGAGGSERADDTKKTFRVERLNLSLRPLQLELYVSIK